MHEVVTRVRFEARAGTSEIDPRADRDRCARQRQTSVAQREQRAEDERAAGGVAAEGDVRRRHSLPEEMAIRLHRVRHRRGDGMLRCESILEGERARARRASQRADHLSVRAERAEDEAAAMEVEEDRLAGIGRLEPGGVERSLLVLAGIDLDEPRHEAVRA